MTAHAYTEVQLVEQPAIGLFAELGWQTVPAMEEVFGLGGTLGREMSGEVVLAPRLRAMLERLNPQLPAEAITSALDALTRDRSAMSLAGANREIARLLKDGVKVAVPDRERGGLRDERVRVVDWENPAANDFVLVIADDGHGSARYLPPRPDWLREWPALGGDRVEKAGRGGTPGVR